MDLMKNWTDILEEVKNKELIYDVKDIIFEACSDVIVEGEDPILLAHNKLVKLGENEIANKYFK